MASWKSSEGREIQSLHPSLITPSPGQWGAGKIEDTYTESQLCLEFPCPSAFRQNGGYGSEYVLPLPPLSWWRAQVRRRKEEAESFG